MPKAPEPSSTCQKTTKSLPRISPKSYCYNAVPNRFLAHFSTSRTNGPRSLSRVKAGTHSPLLKGSHTTARTPKQGPFRTGPLSLPSTRTARSRTSPGRVSERQTLPLLGSWSGGAPEERRKPTGQRCAYARRCPVGVAAPLGCVISFSLLSKLWLVCSALRVFPRVRDMGGITTLGVLCVLPKRRTAACQSG